MCHCVMCDCWWCNICGITSGCSLNYCCVGCWSCRPDSFPAANKDKCCYCCECVGIGDSLICCGAVMCSPEWLVSWSKTVVGSSA